MNDMLGRSNNPVVRFHRLAPERRSLLTRASVLLTIASAAVCMLPFRWAIRLGQARTRAGFSVSVDDAVWSVEAAARRLPWRTVCIEKGIVVQRILRRSGKDAVLHYGVRHEPQTGALQAHVWVSLAGKPVLGGEDASYYAEVATYP